MGTGGVRYIVHDVDAAIDFYRQHLGEPDKRLERELLVAVRKYGPGSDEVRAIAAEIVPHPPPGQLRP